MVPQVPATAPALGADRAVALRGCADTPTRPELASAASPAPFAVSHEERNKLCAVLGFAFEPTVRSLRSGSAGGRLVTAVETLAARVHADDRVGAVRAIAAVRDAIRDYRKLIDDDDMATLLDLDVLALVLDHAKVAADQRADRRPFPRIG